MPHCPLSSIVSSIVLSPLSPPTSERWECLRELLLCVPFHLPKDACLVKETFKTTPGRAMECVGRGSGVGVDLALGSLFPELHAG